MPKGKPQLLLAADNDDFEVEVDLQIMSKVNSKKITVISDIDLRASFKGVMIFSNNASTIH